MDQEHGLKRKSEDGSPRRDLKRQKTRKQWRVPRNNDAGQAQPKAIRPGDSGIFATCDKGREAKCIGELKDLFAEYAEILYGTTAIGAELVSGDNIESDIEAEIDELRQPRTNQLFAPLRIDVQCVVFFKTGTPVQPVPFIKRICDDAMSNSSRKRTRFVKRLSPMTLMGRASAEGLEELARKVLLPHFHVQPIQPRKFAIRPSLRNHNILTRDGIIKQVAAIVGPCHKVDLKDYDLLVVVEVYQNVCGVSVLGNDFERLKRYNLAEIFDPTPKDAT